jgi:hypothetical protein
LRKFSQGNFIRSHTVHRRRHHGGYRLADFATRSIEIGYPGGACLLFVLLMISLSGTGQSIDLARYDFDIPRPSILLDRDSFLTDAGHSARVVSGAGLALIAGPISSPASACRSERLSS